MLMRNIACPLMLSTIIVLICTACGPSPNPPTPQQFRPPVLETVMKGRDLIPQDPQGNFHLLPTGPNRITVRVWADANLKVLVDGIELKRRNVGQETEGWFEPAAYPLTGGSRNIFWEITVKLPDSLPVDICSARLSVQYESVPQGTANTPQDISLLAEQHFSHCAFTPRLASNTFDDGGENSKPDGRARSQIVARNVVLAGWLYIGNPNIPGDDSKPSRYNAPNLLPSETEDFHYDLWLDDDFLARNYGGVTGLKPLLAMSQIPPEGGGSVAMPLLDPSSQRLNVSSLTLPGSELFAVELNAWHSGRRGPKPNGWVDDPDPNMNGNAWPFHPTRPLGVGSNDPDLKPGDYVIISGTLWQDTAHLGMNDPGQPNRRCFDSKFKGHAGWLEIHPVDSVRKVDSPALRLGTDEAPTYYYRKDPFMRSICDPAANQLNEYIAPRQSPPDANAVLKFEVQPDTRMSSPNATNSAEIDPLCPDRLHVQASVPTGGTFKSTYLLWWEPGTTPRAPCSLILLPAAPQTIGQFYDR